MPKEIPQPYSPEDTLAVSPQKTASLKKRITAGLLTGALGIGGGALVVVPFAFSQESGNNGTEVVSESTQEKAAKEFNERYGEWKAKFITGDGVQSGELRIQRGGSDNFDTVSEGQAYGMIIEAHKGNKADFDAMRNYAKRMMAEKTAYRNKIDPKDYASYIAKNHLLEPGMQTDLMPWRDQKDGTIKDRKIDIGAARDPDLDMAYAPIAADTKWGKEDPSYKKDALKMISLVMQKEVEKGTFIPKPGEWGGSGKEGEPGLEYDPMADIVNISYFSPAYYELFYQYTNDEGWKKVAESSNQIIQNVYAANEGANKTGLLPNWTKANGTPLDKPYSEWAKSDYGYDACRIPLRQGLAKLWYPDKPEVAGPADSVLKRQNAFFDSVGPENIADGYKLDGTRTDIGKWNVPSFVTTAAVGEYASGDAKHSEEMLKHAIYLRKQPSKDGYYHESLHLLSVLAISGKMINPYVENSYKPADSSQIIRDENKGKYAGSITLYMAPKPKK